MDSGPRSCSDLRLDRDIHSRHWFLFHSQAAAHEFVRAIGRVVMLGAVDRRRYAAWLVSVYQWHWRTLLPLSAVLEFAAFLIFFRTVSGHRPQGSGKTKLEDWVFVVITGSVGLLLTLLVNFGVTLFLALRGTSPEIPADFDQRFLVLQTWGFLVPFVWGFSAKWLPVFLGLRPVSDAFFCVRLL